MDIRELKQRRFWATHFNREWTFYILGTFLGSVFAQICRQIVFIRGKKLCNTNLVASREKASFPVDVRRLSSLLARPVSVFLWTKTRKKNREQYPAILTEQTWLIKDLLYGREDFCSRDQSGKRTSFFGSSTSRWRVWERTLVPEVFLEIFLRFRKSEPRSGEEREKNVFLSLFAASRLVVAASLLALSFTKKNFKKNLWDQGTGNEVEREISSGQDRPFLAWQPIRTQNSLHLAISRNQPFSIQIIRFTAVQD